MSELEELRAAIGELRAKQEYMAQILAGLSANSGHHPPTGVITAAEALEFERLPSATIVGKRYAAYRFGCSERAVMRREAGTYLIKWTCRKPFKATKREVDRAHREHSEPRPVKAAQIRKQANVRRRTVLPKAA